MYRNQDPTPLCDVCREPATATCPRCGGPRCHAHKPDAGTRCLDCENTWLARRAQRTLGHKGGPVTRGLARTTKWAGGLGALGVAGAALVPHFGAAVWCYWLAWATLPLAACAAVAVPFVWAAEWRLHRRLAPARRAFLAEGTAA